MKGGKREEGRSKKGLMGDGRLKTEDWRLETGDGRREKRPSRDLCRY